MFNKKLKVRVSQLEELLVKQSKINENLVSGEGLQNKINGSFYNAIDVMTKELQILTARVEILEKKLSEKESAEAESLEDELDRNGGTISDE